METGKVIYKELSYEIVGAAFEVFKELGPGYKEKHYEDAVSKEFTKRNISYKRQIQYKLLYKGESIGMNQFDFLIDDRIIVELKRGDYYSKNNIDQVIQYLKTSKLKLAILINFTSTGVKFKRILNIK
ncbi:MAG: GxxExxY protein [Candidatus Moranbacteria bacterium]|nr:GxxExxY protein [Candidatus Moranbacteria bacterium]